jgi:hypothetical protein
MTIISGRSRPFNSAAARSLLTRPLGTHVVKKTTALGSIRPYPNLPIDEAPGMPKYFFDLLRDSNEKKSAKDPVAVIFQSTEGSQGAPSFVTTRFNLETIAKIYRVALKILTHPQEIRPQLQNIYHRVQSPIHLVVFNAHGQPDAIVLSDHETSDYNSSDIKSEDFDSVTSPDATIALFSCSTGQKLAPLLAQKTQRRVIAPMDIHATREMLCIQCPEHGLELHSYRSGSDWQCMRIFDKNEHPQIPCPISNALYNEKKIEQAAYLEREAQKGDVKAQYLLAGYYKGGSRALQASPEKYLYWLKSAADGGVPHAQHQMGREYMTGKIIPRSYPHALTYLLRALATPNYDLQELVLSDLARLKTLSETNF